MAHTGHAAGSMQHCTASHARTLHLVDELANAFLGDAPGGRLPPEESAAPVDLAQLHVRGESRAREWFDLHQAVSRGESAGWASCEYAGRVSRLACRPPDRARAYSSWPGDAPSCLPAAASAASSPHTASSTGSAGSAKRSTPPAAQLCFLRSPYGSPMDPGIVCLLPAACPAPHLMAAQEPNRCRRACRTLRPCATQLGVQRDVKAF